MVYIFDGTKNGFLSAFLEAFNDTHALVTSKQTQLPLGEEPIFVATNAERAERAENRLLSFDRDCMFDLDRLLRCGQEDSEQTAFEYLRFLAQQKRPVGKQLAVPCVFKAVNYMKKVGLEIHHMHGFLRFMETESGALYAPFSPDNDICDLLAPHFRARLPKYPFVLHDIKRQKATVYDGKNTFNAYLPHADVLISADEEGWQKLWKGYYKAVNIPSRERIRQMKNFMPVRYWKHLPEKQEPIPKPFTEA